MEKVHGIGGFFFRASDPEGLAKWYATHLGVDLTPQSNDATAWTTHKGTTVFQPFQRDTQYFGRANGKFARLQDPEGNPIQLWEPGGVDKSLEGA
jgi:glyoxylase I family protein